MPHKRSKAALERRRAERAEVLCLQSLANRSFSKQCAEKRPSRNARVVFPVGSCFGSSVFGEGKQLSRYVEASEAQAKRFGPIIRMGKQVPASTEGNFLPAMHLDKKTGKKELVQVELVPKCPIKGTTFPRIYGDARDKEFRAGSKPHPPTSPVSTRQPLKDKGLEADFSLPKGTLTVPRAPHRASKSEETMAMERKGAEPSKGVKPALGEWRKIGKGNNTRMVPADRYAVDADTAGRAWKEKKG